MVQANMANSTLFRRETLQRGSMVLMKLVIRGLSVGDSLRSDAFVLGGRKTRLDLFISPTASQFLFHGVNTLSQTEQMIMIGR